ncbi:MAG: hypothetical protein KJ025_12410 [Burkholderiales bacterium]|nr:hypothetical protein [Burkholderiales bacterium]
MIARRRAHAAALAALLALAGAGPLAAQERFSFALMGDAPYFDLDVPAVESMLAEIDAAPVAFAAHLGDIKRASAPCTDALFEERRALLDRSRHPLVFVPGDNEWTDCDRSGSDPEERLSALRRVFHSGDQSLGRRRIALERQSADPRFAGFREHVRWVHGGVLFVTLNVPGSNNNLGRSPAADAEHRRRMAAVFDWLDEAMKLAESRGLAGVVILLHGDPRFDRDTNRRVRRPDGYLALRNVLRAHAGWYRKPMLLAHGDSHAFVLDRPLVDPLRGLRFDGLTRVEVPGWPVVDWVRVDVDAADPALFRVQPPAASGRP